MRPRTSRRRARGRCWCGPSQGLGPAVALAVLAAVLTVPGGPSSAQEPSQDQGQDQGQEPGQDQGDGQDVETPTVGERLGLGGDPGLPADAVVPFRAGVADSLTFDASVQNLGDTRVGLTVRSDGPDGVRVALAEAFVAPLDPGEQRTVPLVLQVGDLLPVGDHEVRFTIAPVPAAGPVAGVSYAPGLGGRVVVRVNGEEATVRIVAQDTVADEPTEPGRLSLFALQRTGPLLLEEVDAAELERRVVPGTFRAAYERPALDPDAPPVRAVADFTLPDGADETVVLDVVGFSVFTLDVTPGLDGDGDVVHADVQVTLRNRLEPVRRPLALELEVRRDGRLVELLELSTLLELPTGVTSTSSRYRPPGGFVPGEWQFDVRLASGWFGVGPAAPAALAIDGDAAGSVAGPGGVNRVLVAVVVGLLLVAVGGLWVSRPRRRPAERGAEAPVLSGRR